MIKLKRVYVNSSPQDGFRILVERLWPRGVSKQSAQIDLWLKEISPSPELRKWYSHDINRWSEFQERYQAELHENKVLIQLQNLIQEKGNVTFVYAARDEEHNSALVLKEFMQKNLQIK